jgi:hypothetical protein
MNAPTLVHHAHATITEDGTLTLRDLPVRVGEQVEVLIVPLERTPPKLAEEIRARLQGTILRDDDPFGPAAPPDDWEAAP